MKEIIINYILALLITIISSLVYTLLGFDNLSKFVSNYLVYILLIYYIFMIIYLYKNNKKEEQNLKIKNYFGLIVLGISIATIYNMIIFKFSPITTKSSTPLFLLIISTGIVGPILEEMLFRYVFYNRLKKKYSKKTAIIINSIIFGLIHLNLINIIYAFILGIVLNLAYEKYHSIKAPILIHVAGNIIVLFLYEYSLLILVFAIINLIISIYIIKQSEL